MDQAAGVNGSKLGIVVPLANEEATVEEFLDRVLAQIGRDDRVFCVLDGVSRDRTRELVQRRAAADSRVREVWAPENRCVVDAYFRGYRESLSDGCAWILEMDGGLSHRPEDIPKFIEAMAEGVDFAGGCRFMPGAALDTTPWRYVLSRGGTVLANLVLGTKMRDMTSGFECFTRPALEAVLEHGVRSRAHFFQTEIRALMHDWRWVEVPITYRNPSSTVGGSNVIEALRQLRQLRRERHRR